MFETNKDLYQFFIEETNVGVWAIDADRVTTFINDKAASILGYTKDELLGIKLTDLTDEEGIELINENGIRYDEGIDLINEYKFIHKDGSVRWVFANVSRLMDNGKMIGSLGMLTDITKKHQLREEQKESYQQYISLFDDSPVPIWHEDFSGIKEELDLLKEKGVVDPRQYFEANPDEVIRVSAKLRVYDVNRAVVELNEADSKEHIMSGYRDLLTRHSMEYAIKQFIAIWDNQPECQFDAELKTFEGNIRYVRMKWSVVHGHENDYKHVHLTTTDLTQRILDENITLQNSNREKAVLLKEVHHRVKNNLQIIISLLNLQSRTIDDEHTQEAFDESLSRIQSIAKVHELLYKSTNFARIDYNDYLNTLVRPLIESMKGQDNNIDFKLNVAGIELNINTAIPLGLLINEVLTNSLKHGIEGADKGEIYVDISKKDDDHFLLKIGDNGKGFDLPSNSDEIDSLGLQLIESLTEQLNGEILKIDSDGGTHYQITFKEI